MDLGGRKHRSSDRPLSQLTSPSASPVEADLQTDLVDAYAAIFILLWRQRQVERIDDGSPIQGITARVPPVHMEPGTAESPLKLRDFIARDMPNLPLWSERCLGASQSSPLRFCEHWPSRFFVNNRLLRINRPIPSRETDALNHRRFIASPPNRSSREQ